MTWMIKDKILSDYLDACKDAAQNMKHFKRDPLYTKILEHASYEIGKEYLSIVTRNNPKLLQIPGIFDGDDIGNPVKCDYGKLFCSPTTLQYIGVLSNLIDRFGSLKGKSIIEIGGGYGGQCHVIQAAFEVGSYHIIDLPDPSNLQQKYLDHFNVKAQCLIAIPSGSWDLCISNYALSEIKDPLQTAYVERICKKSENGYVTCNREIPALNLGKRTADIKAERKENFIITW